VRIRIAVPESTVSADVIDAAAEAVTRLDEQLLRNGDAPTFREALPHVRWRPEPPGDEHFDNAAVVMGRGWGDCDDLAPWHAASLRVTGQDPGAVARSVPSGPNKWHVMVQRGDGRWEDPSAQAGMPKNVDPDARDRVSGVGAGGECIQFTAVDEYGNEYSGQLCAAVAPMFPGRPSVAVKPVNGGFAARADIPWRYGEPYPDPQVVGMHFKHARPLSANVRYALSSTAHGWNPHDALTDAVVGVISCAEAAGVADPADVAKLLAFEALARGAHPYDVESALLDQFGDSVVGILPLLAAAAPSILSSMGPMLSAVPGLSGMLGPLAGMIPGMGGAPPGAAPAAAAPAPGGGGSPFGHAMGQPGMFATPGGPVIVRF
jgi:hypothetical protein